MTLAEIAADVAQALLNIDDNDWLEKGKCAGWFLQEDQQPRRFLAGDGSNLADPYWRCACEDWLFSRRIDIETAFSGRVTYCTAHNDSGFFKFSLECPWPEAPARLVSAVWRRKNG